ncbi:MAG TPA: hypothetical protein VGT03_05780 [Candidatus Acidoferrales bacterium]|nr:hypothetical protein [Candidatus Acidoferrales bacterium]
MRRLTQPFAALLFFCAVGLFAAASFAQTASSTKETPVFAPSNAPSDFGGFPMTSSFSLSASAQPLRAFESSSTAPNLTPPPAPRGKKQKLPHLGVAFSMGTLGFGVQAATAVLHRANVRVGFNFFNYNLPTFNKDGAKYTGSLNLRSFEAEFDYYLVWGIHISPGGLLYDGNKVAAKASIPNGNTFTLGGQQYAAQGDITGTGSLPLNRASPFVKLGFGNLLPRNHRHFTFNFDIGAVFQKPPQVGISLVGFACPGSSNTCSSPVNVATDPTVQTNIAAEEAKVNKNLKFFRYYPIISTSIGWKF